MSVNGFIAWGFIIFLLPAVASAEQSEVIEETTYQRVYADGSIELKKQAYREPDAENFRQRQTPQSDPSASSPARGTLQESVAPGDWEGFGGVPFGCNGDINAIDQGPDGKIYLGGFFSACNDVVVNNIAAWDPGTNTFEALGSPAGVNDRILDLTFAPNGDLIVVGGFFNRAGSASATQIARWDGSIWSSVGQDSFNSSIFAVEIDPDTGDIFIGGFFTNIFLDGAGSLEVNRIAVWDGTEWSALGDGFDDAVQSLQLLDGVLYAGGRFSQSGTLPLSHIAAWDGTEWLDVGGGTDGTVTDLTTDGTNLFAGGRFDNAGGVNTGRIARWDATQWSSIDGPGCCFGDMHYDDGKLFVTGGFSSVDVVSAPKVAIWDGSDWSGTADNSAFAGFGRSIFSNGGDIFVGGDFVVIGTVFPQDFPDEGTFANRIARFDGATQQWGPLGDGQGNNLNGTVSDIVKVDGEIWVIGDFNAAGTQVMLSGLARWTGSEWLRVPGDNRPCGRFLSAAVGPDNEVFASNTCNSAGGIVWGNTASFDGSTWQPLDEGLGGFSSDISGVTVDPVTGDAYYYGRFTETGGDSPITVNRIARWDGAWNAVGSGPENGVSDSNDGFVRVDFVVARDGVVMVAGFFDRAGTEEVESLALWDGSDWSVPGDGLNRGDFSPVITDLEGQGGNVFAAGNFDRSGTQNLRNIAEWSDTSWQPLAGAEGEGIGFTPRSLHASENVVYVGGDFTEAGGRPANRVALWSGSDWQSLGAGAENGLARSGASFSPVEAIQSTPHGIFVGGTFGGSSAVTSPNLIRFVPPVDLDGLIFMDRFE